MRRRPVVAAGICLLLMAATGPARADTTTTDPAATDPGTSFLGGDPFELPPALVGTDRNVPAVMDGLPFLGGATFDFAVEQVAATTPSPNVPGSQPAADRADPTAGSPAPVFTGNPAGDAQPIHGGLGFYPGDGAEPIELHQFEADGPQYGVRPNTVVLMEDTSSPANFRASTWGHFIQPGAWQTADPKPLMVISVPLAFGSFTPGPADSQRRLEEVASGADDQSYLYLAQALRSAGYPSAVIRLGWEFDGNWMPWEATQHPDLYIAAFRHIVELFRTVSPSFLFDWTGAAGQSFDGTTAYPGGQWVDIVGMDIYDGPGVSTAQLASRAAFAAAHDKQVSYGEWGLTTNPGDDPAFIQAMHDWFVSLGPRLAYQSYFLGLAVGSPLSGHPRSRSVYAQLFG